MALLIEEHADVLTLVTNSLSNDLNNANPYVVGLALGALANVGSGEMLRDLSTSLAKLLDGGDPYITKKTLICLGRLFRYEPDLVPDFMPKLTTLLGDNNHAIQLTTIGALLEVVVKEKPAGRKAVRKLVPSLVKILKKLVQSGYAPEHDVSGHNDPHLQVLVLRLLRYLGEEHQAASEHMSDILAQVATNTDSAKNAGNAILNEVVRTIMGIEAEPGLRVLAVNILGRFLANRDTNIRYVALATLERLVLVDTAAVQRHRVTIVGCLKDPDVSIRNRALDNVFHLMDSSNVEELTREVVAYLGVAPVEQRADLASRLSDVVDRNALSRRWSIDVLLDILAVAGNEAPPRVWRHAVSLVCQPSAAPLRAYVVHRLFSVVSRPVDVPQLGLVRAAMWVVGEYGDALLAPPPDECAQAGFDCAVRTPAFVVDVVERILRAHDMDEQIRSMCLVSLLKLSVRFSIVADDDLKERIATITAMYKTSMNLELQVRSFESSQLLSETSAEERSKVLAPMPVPTEEDLRRVRERMSQKDSAADASANAGGGGGGGDDDDEEEQEDMPRRSKTSSQPPLQAAAPAKNLLDLDDLFGGGGGGAAPQQPAAAAPLMDLFGAPAAAPAPVVRQQAPREISVVAFHEGELKIDLVFDGPCTNPGQVSATARFHATGNLSDVVLQCAVPKYMSIKLHPASGSNVGPGLPLVTQRMDFVNPTDDKPYMMKMKISYNSQMAGVIVAQGTVSDFPKTAAAPASLF